MSCQICCETLSKKIRKGVCCPLCDKVCCSKCFGKFLLEGGQVEPHCMFCQGGLTMDFVYDNCTKVFMDEYMEYRFQKKFELEKSRLPDTQEDANREKFQRERDYNLLHAYNEDKILHAQKTLLLQEERYFSKSKNYDVYNEIRVKLTEIKKAIVEKQQQISHLRRSTFDKNEKKTFVKKCPDAECRGFLSTIYKCGICDKYFCPDCNVVKQNRTDTEHVCDADLKATYDLLKKDSKPCPKCACMIYKIDGCSQMWCVNCHTAFDWNTGLIVKGYIHNPEYFRYLREHDIDIPRNPNENRCGFGNFNIPSVTEIRRVVTHNSYLWSGWYDYVVHVRHFVMQGLDRGRPRVNEYTAFRISYLLGEIDEETWRKSLRTMMKKDELNAERYLILDMFCAVMSDLFIQFMLNKDLDTFHTSCKNIFFYTNNQMEKLHDKFKSKDTKYVLDVTDRRISLYFEDGFTR